MNAITIHISGGLVQQVISSEPLRFTVIDTDVEGCMDDEVVTIQQAPPYSQDTIKAAIAIEQTAIVDPGYVQHTAKAVHPKDDDDDEDVMGCPKCGHEWPAEDGPPCPNCGH